MVGLINGILTAKHRLETLLSVTPPGSPIRKTLLAIRADLKSALNIGEDIKSKEKKYGKQRSFKVR